MIQKLERRQCSLIVRPSLNRQRALPRRRAQHQRRKAFSPMRRQPQPLQSRRSQNDRVHLPLGQLPQSRVHVPAKLHARHIRPLRPATAPAAAGCSSQCAPRAAAPQSSRYSTETNASRGSTRSGIAAIVNGVASSVGRSFKLCTARSMRPCVQRLLDLLREHPLRIRLCSAHLGERHMLHRIAERANNLDRRLRAPPHAADPQCDSPATAPAATRASQCAARPSPHPMLSCLWDSSCSQRSAYRALGLRCLTRCPYPCPAPSPVPPCRPQRSSLSRIRGRTSPESPPAPLHLRPAPPTSAPAGAYA